MWNRQPVGGLARLGGALGVTLIVLFLEARERQLDAVHGLQPMQEGFFLIAFVYCLALVPAWLMTGRAPAASPS